MTSEERADVLSRYLRGEFSAERAADLLGSGVSVSEVILETRAMFGRLPDRDDAFTRNELRRGLELLGLKPRSAA